MTIVAEVPAFLLKNGAVVSIEDGTSDPTFDAPDGLYYVVVIHRNHLAVMSQLLVDATSGHGIYDFASLSGYGVEPMQLTNGLFVMWPGDASADSQVVYIGEERDQKLILDLLGLVTVANVQIGYFGADMDLNGRVVYIRRRARPAHDSEYLRIG